MAVGRRAYLRGKVGNMLPLLKKERARKTRANRNQGGRKAGTSLWHTTRCSWGFPPLKWLRCNSQRAHGHPWRSHNASRCMRGTLTCRADLSCCARCRHRCLSPFASWYPAAFRRATRTWPPSSNGACSPRLHPCRQTRAIGDAPCESEMQSYVVASDVSTDTGDK